jgi:Transglycosylase SLT domain
VALKSVVSLDLDDSKFTKFKELYDKYQASLAKAPGLWRKAGQAQSEMSENFEKMTASLLSVLQLQTESTEQQETHNKGLTKAEHLWTSIAKSGKSLTSSVLSISKSILKWGTLLGGGLIGGGLFGLDKLAGAVGNDRRSAMGLGLSIGQEKSFSLNYGRLLNTGSFLGWLNEMETDPSKVGAAYSLMGHGLSGDTGADAVALLQSLRKFAKKTPTSLLGTMSSAYGIPLGVDDMRRLSSMPDSEFNKLNQRYASDQSSLNIGDRTASGWQDFTNQLSRAGEQIEKVLVNGLAPLAPSISRLSESVVKAISAFMGGSTVKNGIESIAQSIDKWATTLGEPEFIGKIEQFTGDMGGLADILHNVVHPFDSGNAVGRSVGGWLQKLFNPEAAYQYSTMDEKKAFNARMDAYWGLPKGSTQARMMAESGGNVDAVSKAGAIGAFQFMPDTAKQYGFDPHNFADSSYYSAQMIAQLQHRYGDDPAKALAAYNWGWKNLDRDIAKNGKAWRENLPAETKEYLSKLGYPATQVNNLSSTIITVTQKTGGSPAVSGMQLAWDAGFGG